MDDITRFIKSDEEPTMTSIWRVSFEFEDSGEFVYNDYVDVLEGSDGELAIAKVKERFKKSPPPDTDIVRFTIKGLRLLATGDIW
jgi:hypothetical protein